MKLYFVRHGQSVDASNNMHQSFDSPLSKLGKKQATFLGKRLKNIKFDLIYASPFPRAHETAEIINKTLKTKVEEMDIVHEFKRPTRMLGVPWGSEVSKEIKQILKDHKNDPDWKFEDSESIRDLWNRTGQAMEHLATKHLDETILVVTHEHFIETFFLKAILREELDMSIYRKVIRVMGSNNTGVTQINYSPEKGWKLVLWNDVSHIESPEDMTG